MNPLAEQNQLPPGFPAHLHAAGTDVDAVEIDDDEKNYPVVTEDEAGETFKHYETIVTFYVLLQTFFAERSDVAVIANMSLYYEKGKPSKWYAPDLMVCFGAASTPRGVYRTWREGVFPQVIFEAASDSTVESDLGKKYLEYGRLGVEEYYLLDPEREYLPEPLMAFRRENGGRLLSVKTENGRVFSPRLGMEIVDTGESFRLFNPDKQRFLLTLEEAEAEIARLRTLLEEKQ